MDIVEIFDYFNSESVPGNDGLDVELFYKFIEEGYTVQIVDSVYMIVDFVVE